MRADYRGRGVFRTLYEHVRRSAREVGNVVGIRLYVERENQGAHQTYLRLGMEWTTYQVLEKYPLR